MWVDLTAVSLNSNTKATETGSLRIIMFVFLQKCFIVRRLAILEGMITRKDGSLRRMRVSASRHFFGNACFLDKLNGLLGGKEWVRIITRMRDISNVRL